MHIHGGPWSGGAHHFCAHYSLAARDYFAMSIECRLSGEATWPAQIHDCKAIIRRHLNDGRRLR